MVILDKVNKYFGSNHVLSDISLTVAEGEFVCLLGPSGCGKSTILNLLSGLDSQYQGGVSIDGHGPREHEVPIAYLFQEPRLMPWLKVADNLRFALRAAGVDRASWDQRIREHLAMVNLAGTEDMYVDQLSGGMRHRVSIARASCVSPQLLLMDEPFSALDELTARELRIQLLRLWEEHRKTVLFVTHNTMEATFLADRIVLMDRGPAKIREIREVGVARPRDYDSPELFESNRQTVQRFLEYIQR